MGKALCRSLSSKKNLHRELIGAIVLSLLYAFPSAATSKEKTSTERPFSFLASYRDVKSDPEKIWTGDDLAPRKNGTVSIFEYSLDYDGMRYIVSQIWNDNCSIKVCPTKLVKVNSDGSKKVLVDDMMHQVIPENDSKFKSFQADAETEKYAQSPFSLSGNGKTLVNSDYKFELSN